MEELIAEIEEAIPAEAEIEQIPPNTVYVDAKAMVNVLTFMAMELENTESELYKTIITEFSKGSIEEIDSIDIPLEDKQTILSTGVELGLAILINQLNETIEQEEAKQSQPIELDPTKEITITPNGIIYTDVNSEEVDSVEVE